MEKYYKPEIFQRLQSEGLLQESDILKSKDGFFLAYKSLANILAEREIHDFPGEKDERLACSRFYDDWFLYAVPGETEYTYSLLKLREQEYDAEENAPADGDTPGVTISFIAFAWEILLDCLANPGDENRKRLDREINRVVARRGQRHHGALKRYFIDPAAEGSYLVARLYCRHIAALAVDGRLSVPEAYKETARQSMRNKNSAKLARLPRYLESLNQKAGYTVCDHEKIYIKNPAEPTAYEAAAILATHAGNTSLQSFAAEVQYHAKFLTPVVRFKIPLLGKSLYDSAIRADMTICDTEFEGPAPFYKAKSRIVKRQFALHPEN